MNGKAFSLSVLAIFFIAAVPGSVLADEAETGFWQDVDLALGVELSYEPDYQGSDDYEFGVFPLIEATYRDWVYLEGPSAGFYWNLPGGFRLQTGVAYEEGRSSGDNEALEDLDDIDDTAVLDLGLYYPIGDLTVGLALEQDLLGKGKGLVTFIGARYDIELLNDRLTISPQVDISFADAEHLRTEFGITPEEAERSGFDAYRPGAGLKSYGLGTGVELALTDHWMLLGEAGIEFYGPEGKDSPLLDDEGADYGAEIELGLVYSF